MQQYQSLLESISSHSAEGMQQKLLDKILAKIEEPEEQVRYYWVQKLIHEYGYDDKRIDINVPAGAGRNCATIHADIVVYRDNAKTEPFIVGEVKRIGCRDNIDGEQSASYARNLGADFHFWSNRTETIYWRTVKYPYKSELIGNIPQWVSNKPIPKKISKAAYLPPFKDEVELRNVISSCHDLIYEKQGHDPAKSFDELTKLLFIKLYDEREVPNTYEFVTLSDETAVDVGKRVRDLFYKGVISSRYKDVFFSKFSKKINTTLDLDDFTIYKVVQLLQGYSLVNTTENIEGADIKGTVFELMVGNTFRGELAQFFTPREIVEFVVNFLDPSKTDKVIDPACGSGGFLIMALRHVKEKIKRDFPNLSLIEQTYQLRSFAERNVFGLDINDRAARVAKMNMIMHGDGHSGIYHINGLLIDNDIPKHIQQILKDGSFSIVFSNPPFAGREKDGAILKLFDLGKNQKGDASSISKEVLFIEKIIRLLAEKGRTGLVLPSGVFNNPSMKPLRDYIKKHTKIVAIIGLPHLAFQVSGANNEGHLLFLEKISPVPQDYDIFIDWASNVGIDANGKKIDKNDFPEILKHYQNPKPEHIIKFSQLQERIDPWYYHPNYQRIIRELQKTGYGWISLKEIFTISPEKFIRSKYNQTDILRYVEKGNVDIEKGKLLSYSEQTIKTIPGRATYILREGDILFPDIYDSMRGVAIIPKEFEGCICTNRFFVVRHNPQKILLEYVYYLFTKPEILALLKRECSGEINPGMTKTVFFNIRIPLPPVEEQHQVLTRIYQIEQEKQKLYSLIGTLNNEIENTIRKSIPRVIDNYDEIKIKRAEFIGDISIAEKPTR